MNERESEKGEKRGRENLFFHINFSCLLILNRPDGGSLRLYTHMIQQIGLQIGPLCIA